MCRWFAYISPLEPVLLADVLLTPANAITKQVSEHYLPRLLPHGAETDLDDAPDALLRLRNSLLNVDGLGVAWYTPAASAYGRGRGPRPAVYKSAQPPTNDANFGSLCANTESLCLLAHIRAASGGTAVTPVNCHPFAFGRHLLMHNGVVAGFARVRRAMMAAMAYDAYAAVQGGTDSEHLAALYMTFLAGRDGTREAWERQYALDEMRVALQRTVVMVMELQRAASGSGSGSGSSEDSAFSANSLNLCATDGQRLVACRFRNHGAQQPPSLYWSEFAGTTLNRKYPGDPDGINPRAQGGPDDADAHGSSGKEKEEEEKEKKKVGRHTIVASEPTTFDENEWHLIGKNNMLLVDENGIETEVPLEYNEALNAPQ
ncbi:N-terminal nucleophile aminohydrolase [Xylariaceae sp. FL0804]|nr:N-terminal nucleophile aminohydrolase [Xylariaceae sp. FL0804]